MMDELRVFLSKLKLSNYEIVTYFSLLDSKALTAREITRKSGVPRGRVYDILEELALKGLIDIEDLRPKHYKAIPPIHAMNNLISHVEKQNQEKIENLYNQAKSLELKLDNSDHSMKTSAKKLFWSTAYGTYEIESLYIQKIKDVKEELVLTGFLNQNTIKILPLTIKAHSGILNILNKGIKVYYLWSFEYQKKKNLNSDNNKLIRLAKDLTNSFNDLFNLSTQIDEFSLRFTAKRIPTYYDLFDTRYIVFKLQNPLNPWNIFACMSVIDPNLAENLRKQFFDLWLFKSFEISKLDEMFK